MTSNLTLRKKVNTFLIKSFHFKINKHANLARLSLTSRVNDLGPIKPIFIAE